MTGIKTVANFQQIVMTERQNAIALQSIYSKFRADNIPGEVLTEIGRLDVPRTYVMIKCNLLKRWKKIEEEHKRPFDDAMYTEEVLRQFMFTVRDAFFKGTLESAALVAKNVSLGMELARYAPKLELKHVLKVDYARAVEEAAQKNPKLVSGFEVDYIGILMGNQNKDLAMAALKSGLGLAAEQSIGITDRFIDGVEHCLNHGNDDEKKAAEDVMGVLYMRDDGTKARLKEREDMTSAFKDALTRASKGGEEG